MNIREGIIPTVLGTVVTTAGTAVFRQKNKSKTFAAITAGVIGFGLAHILLGSIDLIKD